MRSIQWSAVEAQQDGEYKQIEPGAYVATITGMTDNEAKEYVQLTFDIAEGPRKGFYSDSFWASKPYAHGMVLSYKDGALPMTKGRLEVIQQCNPGFDPFAAWDGGRLDMFVGRRVGVVLRAEEYFDKKTHEFKLGSPRCFRLCPMEDVRGGKYADVEPKTLDDEGRRRELRRLGFGDREADRIIGGGQSAAGDYSDIPFM